MLNLLSYITISEQEEIYIHTDIFYAVFNDYFPSLILLLYEVNLSENIFKLITTHIEYNFSFNVNKLQTLHFFSPLLLIS